MAEAFLVTVIAGLVELVTRIADRDYKGAAKIVVAAAGGALFGAIAAPVFGIVGLSAAIGLLAGLSAAGVVTVATRIG